MKTIIVDDELWSVEQFRQESEKIEGVSLMGYFNNPFSAIEYAQQNDVDLALLDIEMPGMNGIELAQKLREIHPQVVIVFVTAYSEYLPDFIRLNADYYILKPYSSEEIKSVFDRAKLLAKRQEKRVRISTFGQFEVFIDGKPATFGGKKVKELFALLVDKRGKTLNTEESFYRLWEGETYNNQNATKYRMLWQRLRRYLEEKNLSNIIIDEKMEKSLKCDMVDCDYFKFLDGDAKTIKRFSYAYMTDYAWAEETLAELSQMKINFDKRK
ncbi:MAG: response regulator [Clostridia bacterium]|nr:response regulator [Clostridia bacterium]